MKRETPKLTCLRCLESWEPRIEGRQVRCPRCQSIRWDVPRKPASVIVAKYPLKTSEGMAEAVILKPAGGTR